MLVRRHAWTIAVLLTTAATAAPDAPAWPKGFRARPANDAAAIRTALAYIVEQTLLPGRLATATNYLAAQDRQRIRPNLLRPTDPAAERFADAVDRLQAAFEKKYGEPFDLRPAVLAESIAVVQAEVDDEPVARRNWPVPALVPQRHNVDVPAADVDSDPRLTPGRDVALVRMAAPGSSAMSLISLQFEAPTYWVLDVPNSVDAGPLLASLTGRIDGLLTAPADWPAAKDDARRRIAHAVLSAYY